MELAAVIISGISLLLAFISFILSIRAQNLQNRINQMEVKIKKYELAELEKTEAEMNKSCVEARMIHIAKGKNRLKVWNSGNTPVYNVSAHIAEEASIILMKDKMPYDFLEPQKSFEVIAIVHGGSASKFIITTEWEDEQGNKQSKNQMGDI